MNYPVWGLAHTGGGMFIAFIAIIHVFISHFAVGGGLFLVWTERKAYRENDRRLLYYISDHTQLFMLVTMILGALTGVGIWLSISAVAPSATSVLIHTFVFAWATEWAFFLVEIISLFVYYYSFHKMSPKDHLKIGWIYFIVAWLSLFFINGIIGFMFTPGLWPETGSFWDAFFNPTFWPSLLFRTAMALILAGLYGLVTSLRFDDPEFKARLIRYCAKWLVLPFLLVVPAAWWYFGSLPPEAKALITGGSRDALSFARIFLFVAPLLGLAGLFLLLRPPKGFRPALVAGLLIIGLFFIGSFEYIRETGRRPYVIYDHMYSNSLLKADLPDVKQQGVLATARWSRVKEATAANRKQAGQELFNLLCLSCHSVGGFRNNILIQSKKMSPEDVDQTIRDMGRIKSSMPPFPGTAREREALVFYLTKALREKKN